MPVRPRAAGCGWNLRPCADNAHRLPGPRSCADKTADLEPPGWLRASLAGNTKQIVSGHAEQVPQGCGPVSPRQCALTIPISRSIQFAGRTLRLPVPYTTNSVVSVIFRLPCAEATTAPLPNRQQSPCQLGWPPCIKKLHRTARITLRVRAPESGVSAGRCATPVHHTRRPQVRELDKEWPVPWLRNEACMGYARSLGSLPWVRGRWGLQLAASECAGAVAVMRSDAVHRLSHSRQTCRTAGTPRSTLHHGFRQSSSAGTALATAMLMEPAFDCRKVIGPLRDPGVTNAAQTYFQRV